MLESSSSCNKLNLPSVPFHKGLVNYNGPPVRGSLSVLKPKQQHSQRPPYYGNSDDDDVSDDPVWMMAPRGSLQPAFPSSLLKKMSAVSVTDTQVSSLVSPGTHHVSSYGEEDEQAKQRMDKKDDDDKEEDEDYFPSGIFTKQSPIVKHVAVETKPLVAIADSPDAIESIHTDSRKSMMRYRPSDVKLQEINAMMSRDSLAPELFQSRNSTSTEDQDEPNHSNNNKLNSIHDVSSARKTNPSSGHSVDRQKGIREADDGMSDFLRAAKTGNLKVLQTCLKDRTTSFAERDAIHGQSALHIAVRFGQLQAVELLCGKPIRGLLLDAVDNRKNTPLHLAAAKSRRITKFLLEHGADTSRVNSRNQTPLAVHLLTTKRDDPLITEMLLQHKTDPNGLLENSTLLHKALELQCFEIGSRLVRHGARLDAKDVHGRMVFEKVDRTVLRQLLEKIAFPPVWVPDTERKSCMICLRTFSRLGVGVRRHHCRHCGRLVCGRCSHVSVESEAFPSTFVGHIDRTLSDGRSNLKRLCNTCCNVFDERAKQVKEGSSEHSGLWLDAFKGRVIGCAWDEAEGKKSTCNVGRGSLAA